MPRRDHEIWSLLLCPGGSSFRICYVCLPTRLHLARPIRLSAIDTPAIPHTTTRNRGVVREPFDGPDVGVYVGEKR
jgi:hypothetical protein